jgi:hypothetical protein
LILLATVIRRRLAKGDRLVEREDRSMATALPIATRTEPKLWKKLTTGRQTAQRRRDMFEFEDRSDLRLGWANDEDGRDRSNLNGWGENHGSILSTALGLIVGGSLSRAAMRRQSSLLEEEEANDELFAEGDQSELSTTSHSSHQTYSTSVNAAMTTPGSTAISHHSHSPKSNQSHSPSLDGSQFSSPYHYRQLTIETELRPSFINSLKSNTTWWEKLNPLATPSFQRAPILVTTTRDPAPPVSRLADIIESDPFVESPTSIHFVDEMGRLPLPEGNLAHHRSQSSLQTDRSSLLSERMRGFEVIRIREESGSTGSYNSDRGESPIIFERGSTAEPLVPALPSIMTPPPAHLEESRIMSEPLIQSPVSGKSISTLLREMEERIERPALKRPLSVHVELEEAGDKIGLVRGRVELIKRRSLFIA